MFEEVDILQDENRRYIRKIIIIIIIKLILLFDRLLRQIRRLQERVQVLEGEIEEMRYHAVEVVNKNWQRDEQYARIVVERTRLRVRIEDLENSLREARRDTRRED